MATITLRVGRTNPLTNQEIDDNFTNLNTDVGTRLLASSYTAADVLTKLLTVDTDDAGINATTLRSLAPATANTATSIVQRDASGNFSAGTITATLTGNVTGTLTGNADTVTNGVVTTGSYNNPTWITGLAGSKVTAIPNGSLSNSSITINDSVISLGGSIDIRSTINTFTAAQTFTDNAFSIRNVTTNTKIVQFEVGAVTGTKILTIPDETGIISTRAWVTSNANMKNSIATVADGTALSPGLTFTSETGADTGLYSGGDGFINFSNNGVFSGQVRPGGTLVMQNNIFAFSDKKLKENVVTIDSALDKTLKLRGVYFNKVDDASKTKRIGVIAQEIQEILPEVVLEVSDSILTVDYSSVVALLIEAIKELKTEVDALKAKS